DNRLTGGDVPAIVDAFVRRRDRAGGEECRGRTIPKPSRLSAAGEAGADRLRTGGRAHEMRAGGVGGRRCQTQRPYDREQDNQQSAHVSSSLEVVSGSWRRQQRPRRKRQTACSAASPPRERFLLSRH